MVISTMACMPANYGEMLAPRLLCLDCESPGGGCTVFNAGGSQKDQLPNCTERRFPPLQPDIRLLTAQDRKQEDGRSISLQADVLLALQTKEIPTDLGYPLFVQTASMGGGDALEMIHVPGHSPDSICIRIGEILFIGDLLAAVNPMVAGASGWDRDDYIRSLQEVLWLLDHAPIRMCYPATEGSCRWTRPATCCGNCIARRASWMTLQR